MNPAQVAELTGKLYRGEFTLKTPGSLVTFVRHANAVLPPGKTADRDRRISEKGKRQASSIGSRLSNVAFQAVLLRSDAIRVADTIEVAGLDTENFIMVPEVFGPNPGTGEYRVIDTAYGRLGGNIGLSRIFDDKELERAMNTSAAIFLDILHGKLRGNNRTAVVVGHGWFNPLFAYQLAGDNNTAARRHLIDHSMGECEIIQVGVNADGSPFWARVPGPEV